MKKYYQIKLLKKTETKDAGEIILCDRKGAESYIRNGYAEWITPPEDKKTDIQEGEISRQAKKFREKKSKEKTDNIIEKVVDKIVAAQPPQTDIYGEEILNIKIQVYTLLLQGKREEATEEIVSHIYKKERIYTTRNDDNAEMWIYKDGIYKPDGQTHIKEICRQILGASYTTHLMNAIINKIQADTYTEPKEFFANNIVEEIPVQNGLLNIFSKTISPFTPEKVFFNKLPVTYKAESTCPNIIKHFETILKDKEDIPLMQEIFGYLLLKEYRIEKAIMFNGFGRNGKGKSLMLMKALIGAENTTSISLQALEEDMFAASCLFGKMANISGDLSKEALHNTGRFKELTGRDYISAPRKFLNPIYFVNYAKMIFACNELPITKDMTLAFWSRWVYIDFPYTFVTKEEHDKINETEKEKYKVMDKDIIQQLTTPEELSGLLNWSLEGLHRLLKQGDFSNTKTAKEIETLWTRKTDSFLAFCKENISPDYNSQMIKKDLKEAYEKYCHKFNIKPLGDKHIKEILLDKYGCWDTRDSTIGGIYCWNNIKMINEVNNEIVTK